MVARNRGPVHIALFGVFLIACLFLQAPSSGRVRTILERGITYGKGGEVDLKLDIARPAVGTGPFPALVFIHSGGWREGSRSEFERAIQEAAEKGFVAVTIDYRLTSGKAGSRFPAQVHDVKCAVRWLRANAGKYQLDADHIGALGFSAGAYLALMLGLTEPADGLEGADDNMAFSSRVQAIVSLAGPTELGSCPPVDADILRQLLGGSAQELPELYRQASPITYARATSPPVLMMNGDRDQEVPLEQAELLDARMKKVGASHTLIVQRGAGHENFYDDERLWEFFGKNLKAEVGRE